MAPAVILDIDGTLVDSNYHHALAWYRAFRQHGVVVPIWTVHRHIGMGGDQLVAAVASEEVEDELGDEIREAHGILYMAIIDEIEPFDDARGLIMDLNEACSVVLASSAKEEEVDHYLELLDARELVAGWTTSADVEATKPEPDLICAALEKADTDNAVLIGDSVWDARAASRAGIPMIGLLSGGFCEHELREAGAGATFESLPQLRAALDQVIPAGVR
jgi:phosphoglycolate phosphatase-like HAD superfamily hydrolase